MSTIWGGICLSHNPPIEFDLHYEGREIQQSATAVAVLRDLDVVHKHCDVVIGGYSYPLVAVVCPCARRKNPREYGTEDLRLVLDMSRSLSPGIGSASLDEWLRHNSCWTVERLEKLAPLFHPKPVMPEQPRPGSVNALRAAIDDAGWSLAKYSSGVDAGDESYADLRVYPVSTINEGN